jgi:hypothetical protein
VRAELRRLVELERDPSEEVLLELIAGSLFDSLGYGGGLLSLLERWGVPEFEEARGGGESVREYLDEVVKPQMARAPLAWVALALLEVYDQVVAYDAAVQSGSLLTALGLDREAILSED